MALFANPRTSPHSASVPDHKIWPYLAITTYEIAEERAVIGICIGTLSGFARCPFESRITNNIDDPADGTRAMTSKILRGLPSSRRPPPHQADNPAKRGLVNACSENIQD
jgi:hypothetical protein